MTEGRRATIHIKQGDDWKPISGVQDSVTPTELLSVSRPSFGEMEIEITTWHDDAFDALRQIVVTPPMAFEDDSDGTTTLSFAARLWRHKKPSRFRGLGGYTMKANGDAWKVKPIYTIGRSAAGRKRRVKLKRRRP